MRKAKNQTIGVSPLDGMLGKRTTNKETTDAPKRRPGQRRVSFYMREELQERLRNVAFWSRMSLSGLVDKTLSESLDAWEKQHPELFRPRTAKLPTGRPIQMASELAANV